MNISLKAGLNYKFQFGKHKNETLKQVIDENISYIECLRMYDKIKMDSEALEYFINKKNENLQRLSVFADIGRGDE
jgi:hypothetical protein